MGLRDHLTRARTYRARYYNELRVLPAVGGRDLSHPGGELAWWESYRLLGIVEAQERWGSLAQVDVLSRRVLGVLNLGHWTDAGMTWWSAPPYTLLTGDLITVDGRMIGTFGMPSAACTRPIVLAVEGTNECFVLSFDGQRYEELSCNLKSDRFVGTALRRDFPELRFVPREPALSGLAHAVRGIVHLEPAVDNSFVQTAMILRCLAAYARWANRSESDEARELGARAATVCLATVERRCSEFIDIDDTALALQFRASSPVLFNGMMAPLNHNSSIGLALLDILGLYPNNLKVRRMITGLALGLRREMIGNDNHLTLPSWSYWPSFSEVYQGYENRFDCFTSRTKATGKLSDLSHAALDVEFAVRAFEAGIVFTRLDVEMLVKLAEQLFGDGTIPYDVSGEGVLEVKAWPGVVPWLVLGRYSPRFASVLLSVLDELPVGHQMGIRHAVLASELSLSSPGIAGLRRCVR